MMKKSKYDMPAVQNFADPSTRQMELDAFEQQRQAYNDEMTRLMAKGGEVSEDPQDKAARSIIKDFESYGYTKEEIMELADQVAAAGRGGDELLAYLSPESVRFLKENGGSGTINPVTGLSEFKGGFVGEVVKKIENAFSPSSSGTSSLDRGEQFAKDVVTTIAPLNGPISPQQAADRAELEARQRGAKAQPAFLPSTVAADNPYYESPEYRAYIEKNSDPFGQIGTADMYDSPYFGTVGSGSLGKQNDRAYESYLARLAQEAQRERDAADAAARAQAEREAAAARERMIAVPVIGTPAPPSARDQLEQMPAPPTVPPPYTESPPAAPPQLTPIAPPPLPTPPTPRARNAVPEFISRAPENTSYMPPVLPGQIRLPGMGGSAGQSAADIPISMPAMPSYTSRGIGAVGPVNAATSNYFAMTPQTSTGLAPGSAAIGSPDMPMYGAMNTMNTMGSNPNLSPTMLGGAQNAGFFTDRMGNRITAPGMAPISGPFGFAKGGEVGGDFGFKPPSNSVNSMETVTWYNPKTGQTYVASSGGYTPPSNDWVVRGAENRGGGGRQTAPEGAPGEGFNPSPGFARSMLDAGKALSNYPVMAPFGMPLKALGSLANTYGSYLSTVAERNATAKNVEAGAPSGSLQAQPSRVLSQLRSNEAYGPGPDGPPPSGERGGSQSGGGYGGGAATGGRDTGGGARDASGGGDRGTRGGFAKGGDVDLEALMAQNAETLSDEEPEEVINTDPVGTAQKMLADLSGAGKASPTRQSIKRSRSASGGGAEADKAMQLAYEDLAKGDLGAMKDRAPAARNTESARSQMEELARIYQLKIRSAQEQARGLSADTFGAPTLEGPTLTKNRLTKNRFKEGGEAKKSDAEGAKEPGIFSVSSYAADVSERMFPDQLGQDDQRDAARHMLAAAALSKKVGPDVAAFLGKVHERTSNPESFFSMFGIGKPRDDYELDVHNNKLGVDLASRTTSQADLEKLVRAMALQAQTKKVEGKPYIMGREQMDARKAKAEKGMTPPPEYRAGGSPEEGEESLDKFYVPKARPSTGLNRKKGPVSQAIDSGDAYVNMAKGATELPYDILGAPVDVATMLMRPFGYTAEKPIGGSDFIKEKMTQAGIRQAPPADLTAKGFYTAGELLSNFINPAGVTRAAVKGAEKTGKAATAVAKDFQQYNQQFSAPGASYAVSPQSRAVIPAPASNLGFYSAAEQAALNLPRKEGPGNAFLNDLMKASDVKKEELTSMGLDEFLKGKPKVTRQEVQDFIANNRIDVKEVQLGGNVVEDPAGIAKRKAVFDKYEPEIQALYRRIDFDTYDPALSNRLTELQSVRDREADAAYVVPEPAPTRFDNPRLVLPGGKNYREILLTTPVRGEAELDAAQIAAGDLRRQTTNLMGEWRAASELNPGTPGTVALYQKLRDSVKLRDQAEATALELRKKIRSQTYKSSHFNQPNVLAHMRVNDRVDADGKKMLLIEELQSDWHQAGREKGYNTSERQLAEQKKLDNLLAERQQLGERKKQLEELALPYTSQGKDAPRDILNEWNSVSNRLNMLQTEQNRLGRGSNEGVPDAPFKDTWHQLALKRALKYAADNGYERVGLTTGMQQAQRYNMAEKVDNISYEPTEKGFYINVISKNGANVLRGDYSAKELEGIVGREVTKKMMAKEGRNEFNPEIEPDLAEVRRLEGDDLQVASEGMKKYYDEIYPAFLVKQGKKFNAATGITQIKTEPIAPAYVDYIVGRGNFTDTTVLGVRADGSTEIVNQNANSLQEAQQLANRYKEKHLGGGKEAVRYIDITPEMKGAVPYAKGGEVDKNTAFIKAHS